MTDPNIEKIVSQVFTEKALRDFYKVSETCQGWERNVVDQPTAIKNIIENGAERIAAGLGVGDELPDKSIARMIDHTLLKPEATPDDIKALCNEAKTYHFASVCVNPCYVNLCSELLHDTDVKVCTVIGFPLGANTTETKRFEAEQALEQGATEIDMVINVGKLKAGEYKYVFHDINQVVLAAKKHGAVAKVIIETAGDVALMKYVVGSAVGVKASGGVRTLEDAELMIKSGADRIGASASVKIVTGDSSGSSGY